MPSVRCDAVEDKIGVVDPEAGNDALREYIRGARIETVVRRAVRQEVAAIRQALIKTAEAGNGSSGQSRELGTQIEGINLVG